MDEVKRFVGIDVAKMKLDVFIGPRESVLRWPTASSGSGTCSGNSDFVMLEVTGGLELPVASALAAPGLAVAIVNSRQVRDFAHATGRLANLQERRYGGLKPLVRLKLEALVRAYRRGQLPAALFLASSFSPETAIVKLWRGRRSEAITVCPACRFDRRSGASTTDHHFCQRDAAHVLLRSRKSTSE